MYIVSKLIYRFSTIPIYIPVAFLRNIKESFLKRAKVRQNLQETSNKQSNSAHEEESWRTELPDLKTSQKLTVNKTAQYQPRDRQADQ